MAHAWECVVAIYPGMLGYVTSHTYLRVYYPAPLGRVTQRRHIKRFTHKDARPSRTLGVPPSQKGAMALETPPMTQVFLAMS
jgi:hypothetical protein